MIASNTGANAELVQDGKCGLPYRYGDINDLVEKLRFALNHREKVWEMGKMPGYLQAKTLLLNETHSRSIGCINS